MEEIDKDFEFEWQHEPLLTLHGANAARIARLETEVAELKAKLNELIDAHNKVIKHE